MITSQYFNISGTASVFASNRHIASKQHCSVWTKSIANVWSQVQYDNYDLVNNSIVLNTPILSTLAIQAELRVADSQEELGTSPTDISILAGLNTEIELLASKSNELSSIYDNIDGLIDISDNIVKAGIVADNIANVNTVADNIDDIVIVKDNTTNINIVASDIANVNTVATKINNINTTAGSIDNVNTVAYNISKVNTVATNIVDINQIVDNLPEILLADDNATSASTSASQALTSRNQAETFAQQAKASAKLINSIAELKLINGNTDDKLEVFGYYTKGDGGGGLFYWDGTSTEADDGGIIIQATGVTTGRWKRAYSGAVNVKWFGAKGDGVTDDTDASNKACEFPKVIFPKGVYLTNIVLNNRIQIFGEGSTSTILKPYDNAKSIIRSAFVDGIWSYNSTINGIGFKGTSKVGIGFAFGKDSHINYQANDEYCRNVTFNNCYFSGLEKAVYAPFGAIGETFNDCGFSNNKYGLYALSNKFGAVLMHAGNKYFNQGEFSGNDCAIYIHNTADGFGGLVFNGTIFELNKIAAYIYSTSAYMPISYNNVWFEKNGSLLAAGTTTIDKWTGTVLTTQTLNNYTFYLDGSSSINFNGGRVTGIYPLTNSCNILVSGSIVSQSSGYNGEPLYFESKSNFSFKDIKIADRFNQKFASYSEVNNIKNLNWSVQIDGNATNAINRAVTKSCSKNNPIDGFRENLLLQNSCQTPVNTGNGSFNLAGTSATGGTIFNNVTQFTRANFGVGEYTALTVANVGALTTQQLTGYIFISYDIRCISGSVKTLSGNRSTRAFLGATTIYPEEGWKRIVGIALNDGVSFGYGVDFNGNGVDTTWQVANFQMLRFDTLNEALIYLNSNNYAKGI